MKRRPVLKSIGGAVGLGVASTGGGVVGAESDGSSGGEWELVDGVHDADAATPLAFETAVPDYDFLELQVSVEDHSGAANPLAMQVDDAVGGYWYDSSDDATPAKTESANEFVLTTVRGDRAGNGSVRLGPSSYTATPDTPTFTVSNGPMMSGSTGGGYGSLLRGFNGRAATGGFDAVRLYSAAEMTGGVQLYGRNLRDLPETDPGDLPALPRERSRWYTHEQLRDRLERIARDGEDVSLTEIGRSLQGRELVVATVGNGDTDVFLVSEQHGDEPTGSLALIEVLQHLSAGGENVAEVLEELTVHVLPMQNPDGGMRHQRRNWNGVDANRQHHYPPGSADNPSPESQAMIDYVDEVDPLWVADLHTQTGNWTDDDDEWITASNFWPISPDADEEAVALSKRMNWAMYDELDDEYGYANITRYPGGTSASIARNAYGIRGHGSVLLEATGQTGDRGQRMEGRLTTLMREEVTVLLAETADGSLFDRNPDKVAEIPERGSREEWPWDDARGPATGGETITETGDGQE